MPRFFCQNIANGQITITGGDAHHIGRVLRMRMGEELTVCDTVGTDYACKISAITPNEVVADIMEQTPTLSEPKLRITLYQGLPKSDKMDWIVQKSVELGVSRICPVQTVRCIAKSDGDKAHKKRERWQKIAAEAAGQSGRGIIPQVDTPISWKQMLKEIDPATTIVFYEGGGQPLSALVSSKTSALAVVVGPEGGFDEAEIAELRTLGVIPATLGPRILRCETAPVVALAAIFTLSGDMD